MLQYNNVATHLPVYYFLCAILAFHSESKFIHRIDPLWLALRQFLVAYAVALSTVMAATAFYIHSDCDYCSCCPTVISLLCNILNGICLPLVMVRRQTPLPLSSKVTVSVCRTNTLATDDESGVSDIPQIDPESSSSESPSENLRCPAACSLKLWPMMTATNKPSTANDNQHIKNQNLCSSETDDDVDNDKNDDNGEVGHLDSDDNKTTNNKALRIHHSKRRPVKKLNSLTQALTQLLPGLLTPRRTSSSDLLINGGATGSACPHRQTLQANLPDGSVSSSASRDGNDDVDSTAHATSCPCNKLSKRRISFGTFAKTLPRRESSILGDIVTVRFNKNMSQTSALEIMSVENDMVMQRILGWIFHREGFDFLPVRSGEEALQVLEDRSEAGDERVGLPTLILMAVELPGMMDGACRTVRTAEMVLQRPFWSRFRYRLWGNRNFSVCTHSI